MKLFEPLTIRGMVVKNRIVMPAMQLVLGLRNRRVRAYYLERAQGGAGIPGPGLNATRHMAQSAACNSDPQICIPSLWVASEIKPAPHADLKYSS